MKPIDDMTETELRNAVLGLGLSKIQRALNVLNSPINVSSTQNSYITLKGDYNVVFRDPSKPDLTGWRNILHHEGDRFMITDVRGTDKNPVIFVGKKINPAPIRDNAGLWDSVEFRLSMIKEDRMNGNQFLRNILHALEDDVAEKEVLADVDRGDIWGSW